MNMMDSAHAESAAATELRQADRRTLEELVADEGLVEVIREAVREGEIGARNASVDRFALPREAGEQSYHRIGKMLSHSLEGLGWGMRSGVGGQFQWLSPPKRYSQRIRLVHCRGEKYDGYIRVNKKGTETRRLADENRQSGAQGTLEQCEPAAVPIDAWLNVWLITDVYMGDVVRVYLAVANGLSKGGYTLVELEDVRQIDEFDLAPTVVAADESDLEAETQEPYDVRVEDLD